jgi:hypothetical protein
LNIRLGNNTNSFLEYTLNTTIFSEGNLNALISNAIHCTLRTGTGTYRNWKIDSIADCVFNFQSKLVNSLFITGSLKDKYFIDISLTGTTYLAGVDETHYTFETNDMGNITVAKNATFIVGSPTGAGMVNIGFWNNVAKSFLQWNPTAARTITIPDVSGSLAVLQTVGTHKTLILDNLPTSSAGLQPGTLWNDGGTPKLA